VTGLSPDRAKADALYSREWDQEDHGRHCTQPALRAQSGPARAEPPGKPRTSVNLIAAAHNRLPLPSGPGGTFAAGFD
jgi:hypothetical protein